ncbi:MAG: type I methionyl aminopeptidase [Calditrichaeota bacterium]|nr:type I methionyl aminopeptidase [Calditrichota bacterium]
MISIKSEGEINKMRKAGKLAADVLKMIEPYVKAGISTDELNTICDDYTRRKGAISAPLNYNGFPKSICSSVNDVVCHGIPSTETILKNGDIVNLDITVILDGYHGDTSRTFIIGSVTDEIDMLVKRTEEAMYIGIEKVRPNAFFGDIGAAIDKFIRPFSYGIVRDYCGHGIGATFHEDPAVLHYKSRDKGKRMKPGMTFTVEPMINMGNYQVITDEADGWTVYTKDGSLSAQFEHTVLVTKTGYEILTVAD